MKICVNGEIKTATKEQEELYAMTNPYEGYTYEELVGMLVREKYSVNDEFAILRQKDTKPEEYEAYNAYCEACKARAKEILQERGKDNR